ncbi:GCN5-related N-acetyltransferase [Heterostelium album PN500]|uniref:GCN5-related N-acetyltransferase n=1 Tax=Heterostelium pallidum (strain ATCC 26659 / Pp 5 / PN500) TaxID=670386 RepID=D3BA74_HETP5|nr:GCN5-related N-acetyltransferase [Heterostelium album PN500]EFA81461.1 GCN5-related N-acetyltransferase [Heterostelium album PN500]|eukprot:XP_020433579.1 GCN5-related N-acetyltransferase [Heterostelium album PN500]
MISVESKKNCVFKTLENNSADSIVVCLKKAFIDYFVSFQALETQYFENRWRVGMIDYKASIGSFDVETNELVGIVLWCIDSNKNGQRVAFNIATGVQPEYRRGGLTNRMIDFSVKLLKAEPYRLDKLILEVITMNDRAIKCYEKSGFKIDRTLMVFAGSIASSEQHQEDQVVSNRNKVLVLKGKDIPIDRLSPKPICETPWEYQPKCLITDPDNLECWSLVDDDRDSGEPGRTYLLMYKTRNLIGYAHFESVEKGIELMKQLSLQFPNIMALLPDEEETIISVYKHFNLNNKLNEYEMSRPIDV